MDLVITMYLTLMPVIFAGIANMAFCKSSLFSFAYYPMDNYRTFLDGRRILGNNKTWKGFIGMIAFAVLFQTLWAMLFLMYPVLEKWHFIYQIRPNTLQLNITLGFLLGLVYVVCELPNSFIKRRLNIAPGKPADNYWRVPFILIDQADSVLGCVAVIAMIAKLNATQIILYVVLGSLTHLVINQLLFITRLRSNQY